MILNLVSASRVLWQWTKVQNRPLSVIRKKKVTNFSVWLSPCGSGSSHHILGSSVFLGKDKLGARIDL